MSAYVIALGQMGCNVCVCHVDLYLPYNTPPTHEKNSLIAEICSQMTEVKIKK